MNAPSTTLKSIAAGQLRQQRPDSFPAMLEAYKGEIARALPRHLNADTITRIALTCFRMNPRLAECQPASVFACVIQASQLGLRPGLMGECYLIPYRQRDEGYICTLQLGYQGLLELVRRSGLVESISAHLVHEADEFDVRWGTEPGIMHRPFLDGDPGRIRLVYAVARLKGGGTHADLMTMTDIERIRDRSQNVITAKRNNKTTPWDTDFGEMARKTAIRRICKYLPKSPDLATAIAIDDSAYRGRQQLSVGDAISNTFVPPPIGMDDPDPTGEMPPPSPPAPPPPAPTPDESTARTPRARRQSARDAYVQARGDARGDAPPADEPPQQDEPPAESAGPAPRTYEQYANDVMTSSSAETAALVLDEARATLVDEQLDDLAAVYRRKWGDES